MRSRKAGAVSIALREMEPFFCLASGSSGSGRSSSTSSLILTPVSGHVNATMTFSPVSGGTTAMSSGVGCRMRDIVFAGL
jgi:hypothetical protein